MSVAVLVCEPMYSSSRYEFHQSVYLVMKLKLLKDHKAQTVPHVFLGVFLSSFEEVIRGLSLTKFFYALTATCSVILNSGDRKFGPV